MKTHKTKLINCYKDQVKLNIRVIYFSEKCHYLENPPAKNNGHSKEFSQVNITEIFYNCHCHSCECLFA